MKRFRTGWKDEDGSMGRLWEGREKEKINNWKREEEFKRKRDDNYREDKKS